MTSRSPSLAQRAQTLLQENADLTNRLFNTAATNRPTPNDNPSSAESAAAKLRASIQLTFSPYAPRKRHRSSSFAVPTSAAPPSRTQQLHTDSATPHNDRTKQTGSTPTTLNSGLHIVPFTSVPTENAATRTVALREQKARLRSQRPQWHAPWRAYRVISGHLGWVRAIAFDPTNAWFVTGSADRTIKVWDTASGRLKLTLTGHIATVRSLVVSERHPYLFSVGEDKTVKCWDLEQNKVIRNYHGHLSGVYCAALHPTLDVLMTGGRDSTIRVWDIRTRLQATVLGGHRDTVNAIVTQPVDPQLISASVDATVRLWDLATGKCRATLTHHKKGVRALASHPRQFSFASASADNIKTWALPDGVFMRNLNGVHADKLVNALAVNEDGVLVSGGDDGTLGFWDYETAHRFDEAHSTVQPGSLECEAGIFALAFDKSGSRLVSGETDKTVRMWREDGNASEESHPLAWPRNNDEKRV